MLDTWAAWLFITLATSALAGCAYVLGRQRVSQQIQPELAAERAQLQLLEQLAQAWVWRSDDQHRVRLWQAPTAARDATAAQSATVSELFAEPALLAHLQARRLFTQVEVQLAAASVSLARELGAARWQFSGNPRHDTRGRFIGFVGCARPMDEATQDLAIATALAPVIAAVAGPAALAVDSGFGWVVRHANPAWSAAWPSVTRGQPLADWLRALPASVQASLALLAADSSVDVAGWRLQRVSVGTFAQALWLHQPEASGTALTPGSDAEQFSLTVSHDLRAPIRVVEGFTRIVKEDYGRLLDRVGNDHLDRVLGAAARMNLMIDALLTLARLSTQPLARQPVNLTQLAGYVVDDLRRSAPEREADVDIQPGLMVHGDPTLLRLVLDNLLGNAWKYTAKAPRAQISLRAHDRPSAAGGDSQPAARCFQVADNGAGFDMRSADRLFGLFQRLHSANDFPGHGVGLASVKRIVQRHGGEIWAESEPGRGAVFHFTIAG